MGVINLVSEKDNLEELTYYRSQAAVPFGARYRLIDFALSNMVNSGIADIAVLTSNKYRSLIEHLGTGKDWDLERKKGGLFILPPLYNYSPDSGQGDLQNFYQHLDFFLRGNQSYVVVSAGNIVSNIDYRPALHFHRQINADITILYKENDNTNDCNLPKVAMDENRKILDIDKNFNIRYAYASSNVNKVFIKTFIINKDLLLSFINDCAGKSGCNLVTDSIIKNINILRIYGFPYYGYMANIDSINSYFRNSMELLINNTWQKLFYQHNFIYTKGKNEPPAKYTKESSVKNSLIANGCIIEGTVINSILFRGVKVNKGAYIKNSILMQRSEIGDNVIIENAILDKRVKVSPYQSLKGRFEKPAVIAKRTSI